MIQHDAAVAARRAARLGASVAAWRQKSRQQIQSMIPQFEPPSVHRLPGLVPRPRPNGVWDPKGADHHTRQTCASTLAAAGLHEPVQAMLTPEERAKYDSRLQRKTTKNSCLYCDTGQILSPPTARSVAKKRHPDMAIEFDPKTYVTRCGIYGHRVTMQRGDMQSLLDSADPRNWARQQASDPRDRFFLRSDPGEWKQGQWTDVNDEEKWDTQGGGQIYELTHWQWNENIAAEVHNILNISDWTRTDSSISYSYSLQRTVGSKLLIAWEPGGLDVDNGFYSAKGTPLDGDRYSVTISVEKRVRYTTPRNNPAEWGTFFNLMAPALVSMLIRNLVYENLDRLTG
jgi:hypothetical protein